MAGWIGWLIVLYQTRLLQATDLAGAVGDSLDRLLLADLDFWVRREVADIFSPANLSSLYHHRFGNTLQCSAVQPRFFSSRVVIPSIRNISNSINDQIPARLLSSYKRKMEWLQLHGEKVANLFKNKTVLNLNKIAGQAEGEEKS